MVVGSRASTIASSFGIRRDFLVTLVKITLSHVLPPLAVVLALALGELEELELELELEVMLTQPPS